MKKVLLVAGLFLLVGMIGSLPPPVVAIVFVLVVIAIVARLVSQVRGGQVRDRTPGSVRSTGAARSPASPEAFLAPFPARRKDSRVGARRG